MPTIELTVTVWVCDFCGRGESKTGTPLEAAQHFIDSAGWRQLPSGVITCDRCLNIVPTFAQFVGAAAGATP